MVGVAQLILSSLRRDCSHSISEVVIARLRYSALAMDRATTICCLDHQEIRLLPKKIHAPEVDFLSSISDAQTASQKAMRLY